jgi:hypothetical protein
MLARKVSTVAPIMTIGQGRSGIRNPKTRQRISPMASGISATLTNLMNRLGSLAITRAMTNAALPPCTMRGALWLVL